MAIIAEKRSNGAVVRIHDDLMLKPGTPEYAAAVLRQNEAAHRILQSWAQRQDEPLDRLEGGY